MAAAHQMSYQGEDEAGYVAWVCRQCGRRILVRPRPFDKLVVTEGDSRLDHVTIRFTRDPPQVAIHLIPDASDREFLNEAKIDWGN